ncbi:MAG: NAD-dependent epimerase [Dissulfurimicrobium sp.]|uniref:NAD-dependent epimerase n=1 Tax=Dissulfurimicrobium sp. TaxID=2022436 RepID=UPI00404A61C5
MRLLHEGREVIGLDNFNDYYSPSIKEDRANELAQFTGFRLVRADLSDRETIAALFKAEGFDAVINLAAQPGVRYSVENPYSYVDTNLVGFANILEGCRHNGVKHLVFASSSSVYGANTKLPFSVHDNVDHPISLYAATKKANELMAHAYAHLYGLPSTGLRFFTVYGPWGRPDMALFLFTKAILEDRPIDVFNFGKMQRDFTYIDDIIEGVTRILDRAPVPDSAWDRGTPDPATSYAPYRLYNIGNNKPVELLHFIEVIEKCLGKKAKKNFLPIQPGDVSVTYADISELERDIGFKPQTSLEEGIPRFIDWYKKYYKIGG